MDYTYVTTLRREVINLIEPFRLMSLETKEKQVSVSEQLKALYTQTSEFQLKTNEQLKTFATTIDMKSRD